MEDINKFIKQCNNALDDKLKQLEILEEEKKDILIRYSKASEEERLLIEQEIIKSEEKYKKLAEETAQLAKKIKKVKNEYC